MLQVEIHQSVGDDYFRTYGASETDYSMQWYIESQTGSSYLFTCDGSVTSHCQINVVGRDIASGVILGTPNYYSLRAKKSDILNFSTFVVVPIYLNGVRYGTLILFKPQP